MIDTSQSTDLAHLRPAPNDEIDLGQLISNLIKQWKLVGAITFLGAVIGVVAALAIPKQYRVEAVFDKPSTSHVSALLSQPFVKLDRQTVLSDFLKNLKSQALIEQALEANNLLLTEEGEPLSAQERFSAIRKASNNIRIAPAKFDFLPELKDQPEDLDQISLSLLSTEPSDAQVLLNTLLELAAVKTTADFAADITGAQAVELAKLNNQIAQLTAEAESQKATEISTYENAIAVAEKLGIEQPTVRAFASDDLYLKGTQVLRVELEGLKASPLKLGSLVTGYDSEGTPLFETANAIQGRIGALKGYSLNTTEISYVADTVQAQIPATAEKPNRKLIAVAATVLAGFLGLFIALIRIAITPKD